MRNSLKVLLLVCLVAGGIGCSKLSERKVGVSPDQNPPDSPAAQPVTISPLEGTADGTGSPQGQASEPLSEVLRRYVQKPETSSQANTTGLSPRLDKDGYRTQVWIEAYDPCRDKPCPEEEEDTETEEDLKYSLPPRH